MAAPCLRVESWFTDLCFVCNERNMLIQKAAFRPIFRVLSALMLSGLLLPSTPAAGQVDSPGLSETHSQEAGAASRFMSHLVLLRGFRMRWRSIPALYAHASSMEDHFLVREDICGPLIFHQMKS
jgi:hypothetical protein